MILSMILSGLLYDKRGLGKAGPFSKPVSPGADPRGKKAADILLGHAASDRRIT